MRPCHPTDLNQLFCFTSEWNCCALNTLSKWTGAKGETPPRIQLSPIDWGVKMQVKGEKEREWEQHTAANTPIPLYGSVIWMLAAARAHAHTHRSSGIGWKSEFLGKTLELFFQEPHDMVFAVSSYSHLISVITLALFIPSHFLRRKRPNTLPGKLAILSHTSPILKIALRENESFNISWYMHLSGRHKTHFSRMKNVNNRD